MARTRMTLQEFKKAYKKQQAIKKVIRLNKYAGLQECMKNVHKCNATKLCYY